MSEQERERYHHEAVGWLLATIESNLPGMLAATADQAQQAVDRPETSCPQGVADQLRRWSERDRPIGLSYRWRLTTEAIRGFLVEKGVPRADVDEWADALAVLVREELVGRDRSST